MTNKEKKIILEAREEGELMDAVHNISQARQEISNLIDKAEADMIDEEIDKPSPEMEEIMWHLEQCVNWLDDALMDTEAMDERIYKIWKEQKEAAK